MRSSTGALKSYFVRKRQIVQASIGGADVGACGPNRVTLREMLNEWAGHDLMHTVQAELAVMQPFITASGPWRGYFADHDAGAVGS